MTAEQLKELRRQSGMTQMEFADYMGIGYHSIRAWERGERPVPYPTDLFIEHKMKELIANADQEEARLNRELRKSPPKRKPV